MPYPKRPSDCSVLSNSSGSSGSSSAIPSTPPSISTTRHPSMALALTPEVVEDEDEEPYISIGPEIIDENPFDPSLPDEVYFQIMKLRRAESQAAAQVAPGSSLYERISRIVPNHSLKPRHSGPRRGGSWRSRLGLGRESSEGQDGMERTNPSQRREGVPEPGVVLSCSSNPATRWGLVSLDTARERGDIVRRPEGFEMDEQRKNRVP